MEARKGAREEKKREMVNHVGSILTRPQLFKEWITLRIG